MGTGRDDGDDGQRLAMKTGDATPRRPPQGPVSRRITRVKRAVLLTANRWLVTAALLAATFAVIVAAGTYGPVSVQSFLTAGTSPGAILVELMKVIVSVVVIVLSINQLVLSPGLGPVSDQQTRYDDSMELRERMESLTGVGVSPSSPALFLQAILDEIARQADEIHDDASKIADPSLEEDVRAYAAAVASEARAVSGRLSEDRFGVFEATPTVLRFAISEKVRRLRELETELAKTDAALDTAAFDRLDDRFELFTVSREYLKTVYIRSEYVNFSEALLFTGLPSLVATYVATQIYAPNAFPGTTLGFETQLLFVSLAVTTAILPFALLTAYVFRLAAMSRSTLFVGPFAAGRGE